MSQATQINYLCQHCGNKDQISAPSGSIARAAWSQRRQSALAVRKLLTFINNTYVCSKLIAAGAWIAQPHEFVTQCKELFSFELLGSRVFTQPRPLPDIVAQASNEDCCGCMSIVVHKRLLDMRWTPRAKKTISI
jgi:hypothetical protein